MKELKDIIRKFAEDRDWGQFHSPKNLSMALSVESSELVEIFQWMTEEESKHPDEKTLNHIEEEIGDIMCYLTNLADKFNINPVEAAKKKMIKNAKKYPAEKVKGKSKKYNEYDD